MTSAIVPVDLTPRPGAGFDVLIQQPDNAAVLIHRMPSHYDLCGELSWSHVSNSPFSEKDDDQWSLLEASAHSDRIPDFDGKIQNAWILPG